MYMCLFGFITDSRAFNSYKERFSEGDIVLSFLYLLKKLETFWSDVDFSELKKICMTDNRLSNELTTSVSNANDLEKTFDILSSSPYCTWVELRILRRMAKVANVLEATDMINTFEQCVHRRKCSEVAVYFVKECINPDHLIMVEAKLNKNADNLFVSDLIKYCHKLESICRIPPESSVLVRTENGCLKICFTIPTYCYLHAYEIIKSDFWRLRPIHIQYLQIGTFPKIYAVDKQRTSADTSFLNWISSFDSCKLNTIHFKSFEGKTFIIRKRNYCRKTFTVAVYSYYKQGK